MNYNGDDYSEGYAPIKEAFRALSKDDILEPYISDNDFRSTSDGKNTEYNLYVFDIRYRKNYESSQPIKSRIQIRWSHTRVNIWLSFSFNERNKKYKQ